MITRRHLLVGAGAVALVGCATNSGEVMGAYTRVGSFNVNFGRRWSDITFMLASRPRNMRLLSIDGPLLNRLYLVALEPGESLLRPRDNDTPRPIYRATPSKRCSRTTGPATSASWNNQSPPPLRSVRSRCGTPSTWVWRREACLRRPTRSPSILPFRSRKPSRSSSPLLNAPC